MSTEPQQPAGPDPEPTSSTPTTGDTEMTEQPVTMPFRVEPSTPVPDDRPSPGSYAAQQPPAPVAPAPVVAPTAHAPLVTVRRGPAPATILLGLLSVLVAGWFLVVSLIEPDLDIRTTLPMVFAAVGGILLVVGLIGVVTGRRR